MLTGVKMIRLNFFPIQKSINFHFFCFTLLIQYIYIQIMPVILYFYRKLCVFFLNCEQKFFMPNELTFYATIGILFEAFSKCNCIANVYRFPKLIVFKGINIDDRCYIGI